jgi:beta-lactamase superfamily II metal-dependent hydrolase
MAVKAKVDFMFHNVGQGLFYTGKLKLENKNIDFIYDCGSKNNEQIKKSVIYYKNEMGEKDIDLLIISHLHDDHVSGLNELLEKKIHCVILPYFSPLERLIITLRGKEEEKKEKERLPGWYYSFLQNPVGYLRERGVDKVVVIGNEGSQGGQFHDEIPSALSGESLSSIDPFNFDNLPNDKNLIKKIIKNEPHLKEFISKKKLLVKNHSGYVIASGFWLFKFFNYKVGTESLNRFRDCIEKHGITNPMDAIINKKRLRKLRKCYTQLVGYLDKDFNNTSLVVYHGPLGKNKSDIRSFQLLFCYCPYLNRPPRCFYYPFRFDESVKHCGQLLTGDIDYNFNYQELIGHYNRHLESIGISLIPHHGAKINWNPDILNQLNNCKFWVVSAGLTNTYGHPNYQVLLNILKKGLGVIFVNQINFMLISGEITWQVPRASLNNRLKLVLEDT